MAIMPPSQGGDASSILVTCSKKWLFFKNYKEKNYVFKKENY